VPSYIHARAWELLHECQVILSILSRPLLDVGIAYAGGCRVLLEIGGHEVSLEVYWDEFCMHALRTQFFKIFYF
jgi:hypothetical protein